MGLYGSQEVVGNNVGEGNSVSDSAIGTLVHAGVSRQQLQQVKEESNLIGEMGCQYYERHASELAAIVTRVEAVAEDTLNRVQLRVNATVGSAAAFRVEVGKLLNNAVPNVDSTQLLDDVERVALRSVKSGMMHGFYYPVKGFLEELPKKICEKKPMLGLGKDITAAATAMAREVTYAHQDLNGAVTSFIGEHAGEVSADFAAQVDAHFRNTILNKTTELVLRVKDVLVGTFVEEIEAAFKTISTNIAMRSKETISDIKAAQQRREGRMNLFIVKSSVTAGQHAELQWIIQEASSGLGEVARDGQIDWPEAADNAPDLQQQRGHMARRGGGQHR
ncbi:MAG: hypothetical protein ACTJLK_02350 [Anaplasma sp.]